ncbi:MAG: HEAT repeat domain-containing protein [Planctomycetes bacterium]|nr:HEAT repeat domain-containing protein [Planctomycetota bacterium]
MTRNLCFAVAFLLAGVALAEVSPGDIRKIMKSGERDEVSKLLGELNGALDKNTVKAVLSNATRVRSLGVYDELVTTLNSARGEALEELIKQCKRNKQADVRFLIVDGLGRLPELSAEQALVEALTEDKDETVAVLAARKLGKRGTPTAVDALIPVLEDLEKDGERTRLIREVNGALATLTGNDLDNARGWKTYWDAHRAEFTAQSDDAGEGTQTRSALDRMKKERPGDARTMTRIRDDEIIAIKGSSDKVEDVLKQLDVKHQTYERDAFDTVKLDPERQVLILNCAGNKNLSEAGIQRVREFVANGGYLFTSDWELRNTLEKAFPEVVGFLKETPSATKKVKIKAPAEAYTHPLMRDVFPLGTWSDREFSWSLDGRSHLVKPNPAITVLVECPEISDLGSTTVAFTFGFSGRGGGRPVTGAPGKGGANEGGRVLHVLSHFKNQKDESGDGYALQQLLLNFIVEKQEARKAAKLGGKKRR